MSDLEQVKGLIAQGDKEKAVEQLASIVMENKHDIEAWLLLGEIIDDPSKKKDCYSWVLKLSPQNSLALTKLQELEPPASDHQIALPVEAKAGTERPSSKSGQNLNYVPNQNLYSTSNNSNDDADILSAFIMGVVAFLMILFVIVGGNFSNNFFYGGLFFLILCTGIIILLMTNKSRR